MTEDKTLEKLNSLGLTLPDPLATPPGLELPFSWVRIAGDRAIFSGHLPTNMDGSLAEPLGKVGAELTVEEGYESAKLVGLAVLGSLKRELGSLDRIDQFVRIFGMVNAAPGYIQLPQVINGFSHLILEVFGQERGQHARSAVGMAELPFSCPVEFEGEVKIISPSFAK